ncbi:hypothetical protein F5B19DRAFT_471411 [Rostrohypoxylon terebratum]|nr:hypothetical protein F5B19DRAFT_471411 [Rostrohypoxylon terebratum]
MAEDLALPCVPPLSPKSEPTLTIIITQPTPRSGMSEEEVQQSMDHLRVTARRRRKLPQATKVSELQTSQATKKPTSLNAVMAGASAKLDRTDGTNKPHTAPASNVKKNKKSGLSIPFRHKRPIPAHGTSPRRQTKSPAPHTQAHHHYPSHTKSRPQTHENEPGQHKNSPNRLSTIIELPEHPHNPDLARRRASTDAASYWTNDAERERWQRSLVHKLVRAKHAQLDRSQGPLLRLLRSCSQLERLELVYRTCEIRLLQHGERERKAALRERHDETYHDRALDEDIRMWRARGSALVRMDLERKERERRERGNDFGLLRAMSY